MTSIVHCIEASRARHLPLVVVVHRDRPSAAAVVHQTHLRFSGAILHVLCEDANSADIQMLNQASGKTDVPRVHVFPPGVTQHFLTFTGADLEPERSVVVTQAVLTASEWTPGVSRAALAGVQDSSDAVLRLPTVAAGPSPQSTVAPAPAAAAAVPRPAVAAGPSRPIAVGPPPPAVTTGIKLRLRYDGNDPGSVPRAGALVSSTQVIRVPPHESVRRLFELAWQNSSRSSASTTTRQSMRITVAASGAELNEEDFGELTLDDVEVRDDAELVVRFEGPPTQSSPTGSTVPVATTTRPHHIDPLAASATTPTAQDGPIRVRLQLPPPHAPLTSERTADTTLADIFTEVRRVLGELQRFNIVAPPNRPLYEDQHSSSTLGSLGLTGNVLLRVVPIGGSSSGSPPAANAAADASAAGGTQALLGRLTGAFSSLWGGGAAAASATTSSSASPSTRSATEGAARPAAAGGMRTMADMRREEERRAEQEARERAAAQGDGAPPRGPNRYYGGASTEFEARDGPSSSSSSAAAPPPTSEGDASTKK